MPTGSPFTRLCQLTNTISDCGLADLHVHSTASDGLFTPSEVATHARQAGLAAVAITDHDTLEGYLSVRESVPGTELIAGVELTTEYQGRELHLLGYFVNPEHPALSTTLCHMQVKRRERFDFIIERLGASGLSFDNGTLQRIRTGSHSLGRRHVAELLVQSKQAGSNFDAFTRLLMTPEILEAPKVRLPVAEAIALVRTAGGVSSGASAGECHR